MQPEVLEQQMQQINDIYFKVFDELYDSIREGDEMADVYKRQGINSVHFSKQRHICQKYGCFYDISSSPVSYTHISAPSGENRL